MQTETNSADSGRLSDRKRVEELLERFDRPGPRYTSYPTAVEFNDSVTAEIYEEQLKKADARGDEPLSVYVHLPFCDERCLFCGCHVIITPHKERATPYLELLIREVEMVADRLPNRRKFAQLHLGGGTPTYYRPEQLDQLLGKFLKYFEPIEGAELAIEVDPRVTTPEHIDALAERGFNRISLGVQDFTAQVQQAINRVQSIEQTRAIVDHARSRGFIGINMDLIYGLPHQNPESFEQTIETVIEMGADRAAVYSFAFVPWIRGHQKKLMMDALPARNTKFQLFAIARERFMSAGYETIGMDHFAKPEDELGRAKREGRLRRNFQGYAVIPGTDVLGLGISAIGDVRGMYIQNEKKLSNYQKAIEASKLPVERGIALNDDDMIRRAVIHELMCNFRINIPEVESELKINFKDYFAEDLALLADCETEGLVKIGDQQILATSEGELFVRNLAICFDRYMREKHSQEGKAVFSRTV